MRLSTLAAGALAATLALPAQAQQKYEVKVAGLAGAQHFMSKWLVGWGRKLEKASGGRLVFKHFPGAQMAAPPAHYDLARSGRAELSWFLHGDTPGRFPLTELISLPYMVGSAEIGTRVLNDRDLRAKYLDREHRGVRVLLLLTHPPGNLHTTGVPVRSIEDLKGLRVRFSAPAIRDFVVSLGATPLDVPSGELLERLRQGTVDGVFMDYGGAGIAFGLGGTLKYSTEMYSYVSSFGVGMNPAFYASLPAELQRLIDESMLGVEKEVGVGWDVLDAVGRKRLLDAGAEAIELSHAEDARFRKLGDQVVAARIRELEIRKLPARIVFRMMQSLSTRHSRD